MEKHYYYYVLKARKWRIFHSREDESTFLGWLTRSGLDPAACLAAGRPELSHLYTLSFPAPLH